MITLPTRILPLLLTFLALAWSPLALASGAGAGDMEGDGEGTALEEEDLPAPLKKELLAAVNAYLKADGSPLAGKVTIAADSQAGDTMRIIVIPSDSEAADQADAYLRKGADGKWKVLGLGAGFDDDFYTENNIPEDLRDPVTESIFLPVKAELLASVKAALEKALAGKTLSTEPNVPFTDYFTQDSGNAALLLLEGNEKQTGTTDALHKQSDQAFAALSWKPDPAYIEFGPSGGTALYRGPGNVFAFFSVHWLPSEDSGLSEEADPTLAKLKPEQKIYRVEWYVAEPAPGQTLSKPVVEAADAAGDGLPGGGGEDIALPME